jgi:hypothetical protein
MTSFGREVKSSVPRRKILRLKIPTGMKEIPRRQIQKLFYQVPPALLLGVSADYCQRPFVDESRMIRARMGKHNRSDMVAVYGTPNAIP